MKKAFGLWQALMIILIISGLMVVVLKYSKIAAQHTSDTYTREQLELYLNSAMEMTLLAISQHDRSTGCLASYDPPVVNVRSITYSAHVDITRYYLLLGDPDVGNCGALTQVIQTPETHGMALLEIEATAVVDSNVTARIIRRTLQRP